MCILKLVEKRRRSLTKGEGCEPAAGSKRRVRDKGAGGGLG